MSTAAVTPRWLTGDEPETTSSSSKQKKTTSSGTQWQALGVTEVLAKNLYLRGFKAPTPIQRSTIPLSLATPPRDVLGMARTGSGKTLAYVIPLLQRLGGYHRDTTGPRAIIMCPTRELALQILKVGKDLARGSKKGKEPERQPLRWAVVIGGTSLDDQFESLSDSPDVVIATPGRFLHLLVEMNLDLRSSELIIYDEADRLFEMGFESQLHEITHRLPPTRQSLLFSATLPTTVAEFAKASLTNPALIRLDGDSNLSPDLTLSFYLVRPMDKDAVLAITLQKLLRNEKARSDTRKAQAIVFCATKHHVEYLATLIEAMAFRTSSVYGSLDQVARQQHLKHFRDGDSEVLVVTDVAARGLDIPVMDNVINYDHPPNSRLFIHRVGRTARAGQKGRAVSLVTKDDLPYLCDLEAVVGIDLSATSPLMGTIPRTLIDDTSQSLKGMEEDGSRQLSALREVMRKGHGLYERSRAKASAGGYRKAKALIGPMVSDLPEYVHRDFQEHVSSERGHAELLAALANYRPKVTVMEMGTKNTPIHTIMNNRRQEVEKRRSNRPPPTASGTESAKEVTTAPIAKTAKDYRDPEFYLSHERIGGDREKGYSLDKGQSFAEGLQSSTLDMAADEGRAQGAQKASQLRWDRKKKRFTSGDQVGADNKKMIRSESGALLPATYNSGRFREWQQKRRRGTVNTSDSRQGDKGGLTNGILPAQAIHRHRKEKEQRKEKTSRTPRRK